MQSILLFNSFWLPWVFFAAWRLSLAAADGGYSLLQCAGFSLRRLPLLQSLGSRHFRSCGTLASLPHGIRNLPRAGITPVSPALAGRFLTTGPPGKPHKVFLVLLSLGLQLGNLWMSRQLKRINCSFRNWSCLSAKIPGCLLFRSGINFAYMQWEQLELVPWSVLLRGASEVGCQSSDGQ